MRSRRRTITTALLLLLGGAVVNVAIAWTCASPLRRPGVDHWVTNDWGIQIEQALGRNRLTSWPSSWSDSFLLSHRQLMLEGFPKWSRVWQTSDGNAPRVVEDALGWPALCLLANLEFRGHVSDEWVRSGDNVFFLPEWWCVLDGIVVRDGQRLDDMLVLPTRPIWPGFAINTVFYAAVLWLLWLTPGRIRRWLRTRRGRCPACAYVIAPNTCAASDGLCSECGASLKGLRP